jgi:hypothetical protein
VEALGEPGIDPREQFTRLLRRLLTGALGPLPYPLFRLTRGLPHYFFGGLAAAAIGVLFFLQGARLSRAAIIAGALHCGLDFMR